jgi:hypothetical protein
MYAAMNDTIRFERNSRLELEGKIDVITTESNNTFLQVKSKDSSIIALQNQVQYYKSLLKHNGSVSNVSTVTIVDTIIHTDTISNVTDTFNINLDKLFNNWITGYIAGNHNNTRLAFNVKNEFSVIIGYESQGIFKKDKPVAIITNANPYTKTTALRVYSVQDNNKISTGKQLFIGAALFEIARIILTHKL